MSFVKCVRIRDTQQRPQHVSTLLGLLLIVQLTTGDCGRCDSRRKMLHITVAVGIVTQITIIESVPHTHTQRTICCRSDGVCACLMSACMLLICAVRWRRRTTSGARRPAPEHKEIYYIFACYELCVCQRRAPVRVSAVHALDRSYFYRINARNQRERRVNRKKRPSAPFRL